MSNGIIAGSRDLLQERARAVLGRRDLRGSSRMILSRSCRAHVAAKRAASRLENLHTPQSIRSNNERQGYYHHHQQQQQQQQQHFYEDRSGDSSWANSAVSLGAVALALCVFGAAARCKTVDPALSLPSGHLLSNHDEHSHHSQQQQQHLLRFQGELGHGTFGVVRAAKDLETHQDVAVKVLQDKYRHMADREVDALERIEAAGGHENIVHFIRVINPPTVDEVESFASSLSSFVFQMADWVRTGEAQHSFQNSTMLLFERVAGQELFDCIVEDGPLMESTVVDLAKQTTSALRFLHEEVGLVHADLKPENLLIDRSGKLKVCDFGSALALNEDDSTVIMADDAAPGTAAYCAPELLKSGSGYSNKNKTESNSLTSALDIWSLGCVLYVALSGTHPFDLEGQRSDAEVARAAQRDEVRFDGKVWSRVSDDAKDLIKRMLVKDPSERITLTQVESHPFMRKDNKSLRRLRELRKRARE